MTDVTAGQSDSGWMHQDSKQTRIRGDLLLCGVTTKTTPTARKLHLVYTYIIQARQECIYVQCNSTGVTSKTTQRRH